MIGQRFYIDKYDWQVMVLYEVGSDSADIVIGMLESICKDNKILDSAYESLSNGKPNTGFTYSDYDKRRSFMVIGKTTSVRETINTIVKNFIGNNPNEITDNTILIGNAKVLPINLITFIVFLLLKRLLYNLQPILPSRHMLHYHP